MTNVLIVDDERLIGEVLKQALEEAGFKVTQASNGNEAMCRIQYEKPFLVVCDYMMPLKNGMELANEIRQRPEWSHIPIILMSGGHADVASEARGIFNCVLQKPFDLTTFINVVIDLIGDPTLEPLGDGPDGRT